MVGEVQAGVVVDRYRVERVLATGGAGVVWRVRHVHLGSTHALKVLHVGSDAQRERLLREGRIQAALRHVHIVAVTDVVPVADGVALVLDLVPGPDLAAWARRHPPSVEEVDLLAEQIFAALAFAHEARVIHRDLKPDNVLVERRGEQLVARVTDFGLAVALAEDEGRRVTRTGQALGTPRYMAPELYTDGRSADARTDLFSLGAMLYELLAGRPAFDDSSVLGAYAAAAHGRFVSLTDAAPAAPVRMVRAVETALRPVPEERPASVAAMRALWRGETPAPAAAWSEDALRAAEPAPETVTPPLAPTVELPRTVTSPARPRRALGLGLLAVGALGVLAVAIAVGVLVMAGDREGAPEAAGEPEPQATAEPARAGPGAEERPEVEPGEGVGEVEPTAPKATAALRVVGVRRAQVVDEEGRAAPPSAALAPGSYRLEVWFDEAGPTRVLSLDLRAGSSRVVRCIAALKVCR